MDSESEDEGSGVAAANVAGTTELVEMILLHLPLPDILLAQRVNRAWRTITTDSPKLQRALFFRPVSDKRLILPNSKCGILECTGRNDCDLDAPGVPDDEDIRKDDRNHPSNGKERLRPILNPFVAQAYPSLSGDEICLVMDHDKEDRATFQTGPSLP
ncbi:hypothetical protein LTR36_008761 [Oleoguttula mirabilis]|uniref:F-box domain-containing protein n=1 Tax=Oleoguttula mirabilis TaxID=1507867 RepID=A0AAV9JTJ8_9PEZI|nr:hypothetical protein LTR36_008761 [Oleoguttula mirabilis]